jgi:hypothetical protein
MAYLIRESFEDEFTKTEVNFGDCEEIPR